MIYDVSEPKCARVSVLMEFDVYSAFVYFSSFDRQQSLTVFVVKFVIGL